MATILITGAGGVAIPTIVKNLRENWGYRVFTADSNPHAVGLYLSDKGLIIPKGSDPNFLPAIRNICLTEHVDVVVPLVDEELVSMLELESDGIRVILPQRDFVQTCLDKFSLMYTLASCDIPVPDTLLGSDSILGSMQFPVIVKPRVGRGSRGIGVFDSMSELEYFIECSLYAPDALIVQPYIDGTEYTVSVVVWRDGRVQAVVPKEIVYKKGITHIAITRHNILIDDLCRNIQSALHADGPFNVQLRIDSNTGLPTVFEINPRFSTTTTLTTAAGVDEIGGLVAQALNADVPKLTNTWADGIVLLRHMQDEFVSEPDFHSHPILDTTC